MAATNDLETVVSLIVATATASKKVFKLSKQSYRTIPYNSNRMLSWDKPVEIQTLPIFPFARVGAIGDGNCMLHSILFCLSPTYRTLAMTGRQFVADKWRSVLIARTDDLKEQADIMYFDIGGWGALEESFDRLPTKRKELDIEMAPLIARLYGHNCLAIQISSTLLPKPVEITLRGFDSSMPTVLINYLGGDTNAGASAAGSYYTSGHYEAIISVAFLRKATTSSSEVRTRRAIASSIAKSVTAKLAKKKAPRFTVKSLKGALHLLDDAHTQYTFTSAELEEPFLKMFRAAAIASAAYIN